MYYVTHKWLESGGFVVKCVRIFVRIHLLFK
jgi:hypothetical protein